MEKSKNTVFSQQQSTQISIACEQMQNAINISNIINNINFDEAAENYYENDCPYSGEARVVNREHDIWFPSQAIEDAFKAGAEWMAKQIQQIN